jgi:glycosyltransferase involved in cell wall biosynthesis
MIAMNEEENLPRTLESVRWADEIVVVDSGSKDRTLEIAQSFGAKTSYHAFGGHGEQKNVALDLCTSEWILLLDADEVLTPELQNEIRQLLAGENGVEPKFGAYWIPRLNLYFGRWMRHGGFYPDRKLRLFKRGSARLSEGVGPHSTPQFEGPRGRLRHDMLHYAYPTMGIYLEHMNRYSSEIAQLLVKSGRDSKSLPAFLCNAIVNPAATFIYNYFFRLVFWMAARACCCT